MERTFKIYKYINVGLFLFFTVIFWTTDIDTMKFQLLVGTAGVLILLLIINFNEKRIWLTIFAYLTFLWGLESLFSNLSMIQYNTIHIWILLIIGFFVIVIFTPPATFLNGVLYGMWLLSIPNVLVHGFQFGWEYVINWSQYLSFLVTTNYVYWIAILIFAYVITVLPYYISHQKAVGHFYTIAGYMAFLIFLPITVAVGLVLGIFRAIKNITFGFRTYVKRRKRALPRTTGQPAFEVYWFKKAFRDWRRVRVNVLKVNVSTMKNFKSAGKGYMFTFGKALGMIPRTTVIIAGYSLLILGFLLLMIVNSIHIVVVGIIWIPVFLYYSLYASLDKFYLRWKNVKTVCPSCYYTSPLPDYVCSCGRVHTNLKPGLYGIRWRTCLCGRKLPASHLDSRNELKALCKNDECKKELFTKESTPICISLIGGPSSGKTSFALSALQELRESVASRRGWETKFSHKEDEAFFSRNIHDLNMGRFPHKTAEKKPFAINLWLLNKKWRNPKLLYIYDPAGEVYQSSRELAYHDYLRYVDGLVFVVDPFTLPEVAAEYEGEIKRTNVNPSETLLQDTYDLLMIHFAKNYSIKEKKKISVPIAVVIHKVDAFQLNQQIVATNIDSEDLKRKNSDHELLNEKCKLFLIEAGYQSFVTRLESKFQHVQFFLSSAVSTNSDFQSCDAITWLLEKR